ncbi:hypothetical protein CLOM_g16674 [Closterium sp. NIES-68]|nr:hypothetical protein CLOM_g16674 [Closterium sp. NIES-68]GJP82789.1 hypothetical protein CLOP_g13023 [Closterium sp. NIES-67]
MWIVADTADAYVFSVEQRGFPLEHVQVSLDRSGASQESSEFRLHAQSECIGSSRSYQQQNDSVHRLSQSGSSSADIGSALLTIVCRFQSAPQSPDGNVFRQRQLQSQRLQPFTVTDSVQTTGRRFKLPADAIAESTTAVHTETGSLVVNVPRSPQRPPRASWLSAAPCHLSEAHPFVRFGRWSVNVASTPASSFLSSSPSLSAPPSLSSSSSLSSSPSPSPSPSFSSPTSISSFWAPPRHSQSPGALAPSLFPDLQASGSAATECCCSVQTDSSWSFPQQRHHQCMGLCTGHWSVHGFSGEPATDAMQVS